MLQCRNWIVPRSFSVVFRQVSSGSHGCWFHFVPTLEFFQFLCMLFFVCRHLVRTKPYLLGQNSSDSYAFPALYKWTCFLLESGECVGTSITFHTRIESLQSNLFTESFAEDHDVQGLFFLNCAAFLQ